MSNLKKSIEYLKKYNNINNFIDLEETKNLRGLMNITMPYDLSNEYYLMQDEILQEYYSKKEIVNVNSLPRIQEKVCLYLGDITLLKADAIVNACNEKMLGCFQPLHSCIDNAIHSYAGLQVRRDLMNIMDKQGHDEKNGKCKVTDGYNLPSKYIFHTVGPKVSYKPTKANEEDLKNCYLSCLKKAEEMKLKNIVFCSLSTGVYGYPIELASIVAVRTVKEYLDKNKNTSINRVIFNVFSRGDYDVYGRTIKETY